MSLLRALHWLLPVAGVLVLLAGSAAQEASETSDAAFERARTPVSQSRASMATSNTMDVLDDTRKLAIGDVLSFRIVEDGDPITRVMVTDSGEIEIPYIGRVRALGLTCAQVARKAKELLERDYYYKATVLLGLDYNSYGPRSANGRPGAGKEAAVNAQTGYTIMGMIQNPGVFPLTEDQPFTFSHAILRSGGFQRFANEKKVRLLRKSPGRTETQTHMINAHEIMSRGRLEDDIALRPGDVIIVDRKLINF